MVVIHLTMLRGGVALTTNHVPVHIDVPFGLPLHKAERTGVLSLSLSRKEVCVAQTICMHNNDSIESPIVAVQSS